MRIPNNPITQKLAGTLRPSLGIFGSLSSNILINNPDVSDNLNLLAQSAFRTVSLARPNMQQMLKMILKSQGYHSFNRLATLTSNFIDEFIEKKNEFLYGRNQAESAHVQRTTERLVLQDIRVALRYSILLRDQEWKGYLDKQYEKQEKSWKFELQLYEPTLQEKTQELERLDAQKKLILKDKSSIEAESILEGLKVLLTSKFFNEWRNAQLMKVSKNSSDSKQ